MNKGKREKTKDKQLSNQESKYNQANRNNVYFKSFNFLFWDQSQKQKDVIFFVDGKIYILL